MKSEIKDGLLYNYKKIDLLFRSLYSNNNTIKITSMWNVG